MGATNRDATTSATPWQAKIFGIGFLVWYALIAVAGGGIGTGLNCEGGECRSGFPSWWRPWTWDDYYVVPEALYVALAGLAPAVAFVFFAASGRRLSACVAFVSSLALLSYAFFGGVTEDGRVLGMVGVVFGVAALSSGRQGTTRSG